MFFLEDIHWGSFSDSFSARFAYGGQQLFTAPGGQSLGFFGLASVVRSDIRTRHVNGIHYSLYIGDVYIQEISI